MSFQNAFTMTFVNDNVITGSWAFRGGADGSVGLPFLRADAEFPWVDKLATEYGLADLRKQSECACIRSLAVANVKRFLQLADLHEAQDLKLACFTFVQRHAATVLTDPDMMGLATEEPGLWAELAAKISSDGGKKRLKRARDL